ncbi:hypothetical protein M3Y96_01230100 [Aphelenchoides besseyi]|nr:hypothetical protein M3Y96_01230100 [Aphelenchoides besseyi]
MFPIGMNAVDFIFVFAFVFQLLNLTLASQFCYCANHEGECDQQRQPNHMKIFCDLTCFYMIPNDSSKAPVQGCWPSYTVDRGPYAEKYYAWYFCNEEFCNELPPQP